MRSLISAAVIAMGASLITSAQEISPGQLYRGPGSLSRPATIVEPENGLPVRFGPSLFSITMGVGPRISLPRLSTDISSRSVRTIPVSGITLRAAFGPTGVGMMTFRLRSVARSQITPGASALPVEFAVASEEEIPGFLVLSQTVRLVFTVERIRDDDGQLIFENPDARELLWEALGRPTLSPQ